MAANIDPLQMNYFAIDCDEDAMFYRVVVWDLTRRYRVCVSNPIWLDLDEEEAAAEEYIPPFDNSCV